MEINKQEIVQSLKSLLYARKILVNNEDTRLMPRSEFTDYKNYADGPQSYNYYALLASIEEAINKLFWQVFEFPEMEYSCFMYQFKGRDNDFVFLRCERNGEPDYNREYLKRCYDFLNSPDCDPRILIMFDYFVHEVMWTCDLKYISYRDDEFKQQRDETCRQVNSWLVLMFYCYLTGLEPDEAASEMLSYHGHSLYVFESSTCAADRWYRFRKEQKKKEEESKKPSENR